MSKYLEEIIKKSKLNQNMDFDIKQFTSMEDEELDDDGTTPDDEAYAKRFIKEKLVEAQEIIESLSDYLTYSDYAVNKGGDLFKHYLEKSNSIYDQLKHFMDD